MLGILRLAQGHRARDQRGIIAIIWEEFFFFISSYSLLKLIRLLLGKTNFVISEVMLSEEVSIFFLTRNFIL